MSKDAELEEHPESVPPSGGLYRYYVPRVASRRLQKLEFIRAIARYTCNVVETPAGGNLESGTL